MPLISHEGVDYGSFTYQVQDSASTTDLADNKVPTGRTVKAYFSNGLTAPTSKHSSISDNSGGWVRFGKLVFVNIQFKVTSNISVNTAIFSGLPKPLFSDSPLLIQQANTSLTTTLTTRITYWANATSIYTGANTLPSSSLYYTIAGCYYAES